MKLSALVSGIAGGVALLLAQGVAAHPGHAHDHWSSDLLHFGFYGMLITGLITLAVLARRAWSRNKIKTDI